MMQTAVQLGVGLVGIGRPWGYKNPEVPAESDAIWFLEAAIRDGMTYFDTAPSYGWSEQRLGRVVRDLAPESRDRLTIATKFGERWDFDRSEPVTDHSYDGLRRSLDRSIELLGRIDVLQLHKTTPEVLRTDDLARAWEYARTLGITVFGASVKDLESGSIAINDGRYSMLQVPYNRTASQFGPLLDGAHDAHKWVAVNRPFGEGRLLYGDEPLSAVQAFVFVMERLKSGVILTGTKSISHLRENRAAFVEAAAAMR